MDIKQLQEQKRNEYLEDLARKAADFATGHGLDEYNYSCVRKSESCDFEQRRKERERKDDFKLAMEVMVTIGTRMEFEATPFTLELIKLCKEKL